MNKNDLVLNLEFRSLKEDRPFPWREWCCEVPTGLKVSRIVLKTE